MNLSNNKKPRQRISSSSKNKAWVEENLRYWIEMARPIVDKSKAAKLYGAAFGKLDESEYLYVTNPLNTNRKELKGYPAKIRNYPILPTTVNVLMGEKTARPIDSQVVVINSNLKSRQMEEERQAVLDFMVEDLMKRIDLSQIPEEQQQQAQQQLIESDPTLSRILKKKKANIKDELAIMGQEGLDYIKFYCDLKDKMVDQMLDILCVNSCVSYRTVYRDEVVYENMYPDEISIVGNNIRFIDEAECVVRDFQMTESELLDFFQDMKNYKALKSYLLGTEHDAIQEDGYLRHTSGFTELDPGQWAAGELFENLFGFRERFSGSDIYNVKHVVWRSSKKYYKIKGYNDMVGDYEFEASEDYELLDGEEKEEMYRDQYWEAYEVDGRIPVGYRPIDPSIAKGDNPYNAVNPYGGIVLDGMSIVEMGLVFQIKHNIFEYYIEKLVGKNKDKIILMPKQLIPEDEDMDIDDFFYYSDALGFSFVDISDKDKLAALQSIKVLDASLGDALRELVAMKQANLEEWKELIGSTRQREGRINASDGKATTEEAIFRSSLLTEYVFDKLDRVHRRDHNALVDLSQVAWVNGKKGSYINSDFKRAYLEINPELYSLCEFGIGVTDDTRSKQNLKDMRMDIQAMAQDPNFPKHLIPKLRNANNINQIVDEIETIMSDLEERQAAAAEAQRKAEAEERQADMQKHRDEIEYKYYKTDTDTAAKIDVAMLMSDTTLATAIMGKETPGEDSGNRELERANRVKERLEERVLRAEEKKTVIKAATDKYKADTQLKIARENKQPHEVKNKK